MKENENTLEKAVEALKNEQIPPGPPKELTDTTIAKLAETSGQSDGVTSENPIRIMERLKVPRSLTKVAAAAALLILASYATGRLSAPQPPDVEQLQAALEPAIRDRILGEIKPYLQLGLANCYVRLKDDLSQQYRRDLNQYAAQTLAASGAVTNQLLQELIESINTTQTQDRQLLEAALERIESNRLRDNAQLSNAFVSFAAQTEDELLRTKQDMAQLLYYTQPDNVVPDELKNSQNLN